MKAALAAGGSLAAAAVFVVQAKRWSGDSLWRAANLLTLSRLVAASGLAAEAAAGRRRTGPWLALLLGCTASDWLDGPLARRNGPTRLGAVLDIEADSWLTLSAALASWRSGSLPARCLGAPLVRYPLRVGRAAHRSMGARPWQRAAGTLQMVALSGALAPWTPIRRAAQRLAPYAAAAQLSALAADLRSPV